MGAYDPSKFAVGSTVRIADRQALNAFAASWRLHNPLQAEQFASAGKVTRVMRSLMYHGGYILYELEGMPGVWHQELLSAT